MNLLLLRPGEVDAAGRARLDDRRAEHLRAVLGATPGRPVRCGLLDGPLGTATVVRVRDDAVELDCVFDPEPPPRPRDTLLLAAPRPKVLRRVVEHATALGYGTIVVMRSWRVDRSHLESRTADPAALEPQLLAGLEQARRTWRPRLLVEPLFKPFIEDRVDALAPPGDRFVAHPDAPTDIGASRPLGPFTLAVGPERGFTDYEVALLAAHGFAPVRSDAHPLRVETAVAVLTAQLRLLRDLGEDGNS